MIKEISNEEAKKYIARDKLLIYTPDASHYGYFEEDILLGIVAYKKIKNTYRVKSLYVLDEYRNKGIGNKLVLYLLNNNYDFDCYATEASFNLFQRNGFIPVKKYKNKVTYMKRPKKI